MDRIWQHEGPQMYASRGRHKIWHDYLLLLLALIPMVIIVPVLPGVPSSRPVILIFLTIFFIAGIYVMRGDRRRFLISCILALIAIETFWVSVWSVAASLFVPAEFFFLLFLVHQTRYHFQGLFLASSEGSILDIMSGVSALIMIGGMMLGTSLHLAGLIGRTILDDPLLLHTSFARALPEGVLVLIRGGGNVSDVTPLGMVLLMVGSVYGFILLALSAGKIASYYIKNSK